MSRRYFLTEHGQDETGRISKEEYFEMHMKMQRAMVDDFDENAARLEASEDWKNDVKDPDGGMTKEEFHGGVYQLADIWVEGIEAKQYTTFLKGLLDDVSKQLGGGMGERTWKADEEIVTSDVFKADSDYYDSDQDQAIDDECDDDEVRGFNEDQTVPVGQKR